MKKLLYFFLLIAIVIMSNCRKDDSDDTSTPGSGSTTQINSTISGIVLDANNDPVPGVGVVSYGNSATTDQYGMFTLNGDVDKDRCIIQFTKSGYLKRIHAIKPNGGVNYVKIILAGEPPIQNIAASTGGTVTATGASILFQANSFVIEGTTTSYSGMVKVSASLLSPSNTNFSAMIPGGDLAGTNTNGDDVSLYSYGMVNATLVGSNGETLQLASGSTATITLPIASAQLGSAPALIPLWYFDETVNLWKEEGIATKVGNNYVGTVSHFSWWNCDYPGGRATVNGRVVDCEGTPLANVTVTVNGQMTVVTDQGGYYTNWVPSGMALTFRVLPQGVIVLPSQLETVAALTDGQTVTVPDLVVPCGARIIGQITGCTGEPEAGMIVLQQNNEMVSSMYTTDGLFSMMALGNTNYTLIAAGNSGSTIIPVTSPAVLDTIDVGNLQLCNTASYNQGFTITGNGYAGNEVELQTTITPGEAYWDMGTSATMGIYNGGSNAGACPIYFAFPGNTIGVTNLTANPLDGIFHITLNGELYYPSYPSANPFIFALTYYGPVGDSIKGTFSGAMKHSAAGGEVSITNGKFAFPRTPDH